jgi:hypothetical protein
MKDFALDDGWKDVQRYLEDELARICHHHALTAPQWLTDFVFSPVKWRSDTLFLCTVSMIMFIEENKQSLGLLEHFCVACDR